MTGTSDEIGPLLQAALGPIDDGQGIEIYYNWQATPWLNITPDLQVLVPARENVDTACSGWNTGRLFVCRVETISNYWSFQKTMIL